MPKAITASTQDHLPIEDIVDDLVILKDGSAAVVIQTTAVNFGLLSEKEQDATIFAYGALLNSLSFPIQILIRSKRSDISSYLEQLETAQRKQTNPALSDQIKKYLDFVKSTVQKGRVLDKKFYLVIPFSFLELGAAKAAGALTKRKTGLPYPKDYIAQQARINLYPKKDQVVKQLTRLGLAGRMLTQPELVELYFDIYNPAAVGAQKITAEAGSYTGTVVEPAVALPEQKKEDETSESPTESVPTTQIGNGQVPATLRETTTTGQETKTPTTEAATAQPPTTQTPTLEPDAQRQKSPTKTLNQPPPQPTVQQPEPVKTAPQTPTNSAPNDRDKLLAELQEVINKAKQDLAMKNQQRQASTSQKTATEQAATKTQKEEGQN